MAKVVRPAAVGLNASEKLCLILLGTTLLGWALSWSRAPTKATSTRDSLWQITVTGSVSTPRERLLVHLDLPLDRVTVSDDQGKFELRENLRGSRPPSTCLVSRLPSSILGRGVFEVVGVECHCDLGRLLLAEPSQQPPKVTNLPPKAARPPQPINLELDEKTLNTLRSEPGTNP